VLYINLLFIGEVDPYLRLLIVVFYVELVVLLLLLGTCWDF